MAHYTYDYISFSHTHTDLKICNICEPLSENLTSLHNSDFEIFTIEG